MDIRPVKWDPPEPFSEETYENYGKYTMWLLDPNDRTTAVLFLKYSITMGGLCVGHFIAMIEDDSLTDQQFLREVAHFVRHLMGLEHIWPEYPAIMNLQTTQNSITEYDLMQVRYLYK